MAPEHRDRDAVLRALLVARVHHAHPANAGDVVHPGRLSAALVTAVVLIFVVVASAVALRLGGGGGVPAAGGTSATAGASTPAAPSATPEDTLPAGKLLGRFASDDGPDQDHTIHPGKLAIATLFTCSGHGKYLVYVAGGTSESGDGDCSGGGVGSGNGTASGTSSVKIRTDPDMRWTYTIVGVKAPDRVVLKPIPTPTTSSGASARYCGSDDLTARYGVVPSLDDKYEQVGELVFTNRTREACALAGYPEVRFISGGTALGHNTMNQIDPRRSTAHGLKAVVLQPGTSAYSQINWYAPGANAASEGPCVKRTVHTVQVNLHYDLAAAGQIGTLTVPIGQATACLNGAHGALGKYGQIASTVFLDYSTQKK